MMTPSLPKISIVAPFYNEERGVGLYFQRMNEVTQRLPDFSFEYVCVDDGSKDGTLPLLMQHAVADERIVVVEFSRNFGKEAALTAGLDAATGDAVIPIDSDLQDPPELLAPMLQAWKNGAEVVLARRIDRSTDSFFKRKSAEFFYKVHNHFSSIAIPDNVGDFRLMDRIVISALQQLPERQRFMKGLFAWVGFKTVTVDYVREVRATGDSKFSGWKLWNFALEGITSFSTSPLKIWTYLGGVGATFTLSYALYIVLRTIVHGVDLPGYASLLVSVIFFGSVQLIGIGMLGEYVGRIYMESKQRPLYIVRKTHSALAPDKENPC
jgi:polyisoprenyl-phosphate glycosyltransferase